MEFKTGDIVQFKIFKGRIGLTGSDYSSDHPDHVHGDINLKENKGTILDIVGKKCLLDLETKSDNAQGDNIVRLMFNLNDLKPWESVTINKYEIY